MITAPAACDVLWVGRDEPSELGELTTAGMRVGRAEGLVGAIERLQAGAVRVVVVHADAVVGAETERLAALRGAGAATILALYPSALSWRASRALFEGADASLSLPLAPGVLGATVALLARTAPAGSGAGDEFARTATGESLGPLLADVAAMNRTFTWNV